jgi:N-acetylglucosaminyldiphosphoundecaprenol N-acetyl-beta-D-mannosaminyltransferase
MTISKVCIGGLSIDRLTRPEALRHVADLVSAGDGGFVVTPNIDHVVMAQRDSRLLQAYERAGLSLADGKPLLWMARALGMPLPEKISGSDLLDPLMAMAAAKGWRVFFFGSTRDVSAEAERRLTLRHPGLRVVGRDCSHWNPGGDAAATQSPVTRAIRASRADLVVVALGSPKQEIWMSRHEHEIAPAVALGLGASLDFAAGAVRRAPAWMSRAGFEWLFRLIQEPRRLAYRYLVRDMQVLPIFVGDLVRKIARRGPNVPMQKMEA